MAVNDIVMSAAGASGPATYIEDVFSTYLYTGNGGTSGQTIVNNIDLSTYSGIVWIKPREFSGDNKIFATGSGDKYLVTNATSASTTIPSPYGVTFNANGFYARDNFGTYGINAGGTDYASWTFREQPKFFDIVTYTGTGVAGKTVAHNLGSVPGCIIVKRTDTTGAWYVYHTSQGATKYSTLDTTNQFNPLINIWNNTSPTSSVFSVGNDSDVNANGGTYVAYLFAHDAGGFGLSGTENVISCGGYTGNGSATGPVVTLGYEPQWLMIKNAGGTGNWQIIDNMRGMPVGIADATLQANLSNAESSADYVSPTATGFQIVSTSAQVNSSSTAYIYIAIRRGPMQVPTLGTSVFSPITRTGTGAATTVTSGINQDSVWQNWRSGALGAADHFVYDRLRGFQQSLFTNLTAAEATQTTGISSLNNTTYGIAGAGSMNASSGLYVDYAFRRAPGFFDVVCYTGTGVARTVNHNLGVAPELIIIKNRNWASPFADWQVYSAPLGNTSTLVLNQNYAADSPSGRWNSTTPTSSVFYLGTGNEVNSSIYNYVAYLFATVAGVSKVGSYTGTGATLSINAGFTTGARFVMIKRTDSTGDWFVWDTARGMVAGTDPRTAFNLDTAESNANWVYTATSGFQIVTTDATVNASGGSYIYLAIA